VSRWSDFKLIDGSLEAMARLSENGFKIAIATNQAGIGKGIMDDSQFSDIMDNLSDLTKSAGGRIDYVAYCPHDYAIVKWHCRKPKTGLLQQIEDYFRISVKEKYFVGDKISDISAARNYGCIPLLVSTGYGEEAITDKLSPPNKHCFKNLYEASTYIIENKL